MRHRAGFTLVEVLVSLGVMTIGAMAIIAMQQQTTRANIHARQLTTATQVAQNVIERLKLEGEAWHSVTGNVSDFANAPSLSKIISNPIGQFADLPPRTVGSGSNTRVLSNAFDYYGNDLDLTNASQALLARVTYCASTRLSWVYPNQRVMRVDVRVWWSREWPMRQVAVDFPNCADNGTDLNPGGKYFSNYHTVYLSTVIRAH